MEQKMYGTWVVPMRNKDAPVQPWPRYPQVSMDVFVGNMERGVEIAEHYFPHRL